MDNLEIVYRAFLWIFLLLTKKYTNISPPPSKQ